MEKIDKSGEISLRDLPDTFVKKCEKSEKIINNLKNSINANTKSGVKFIFTPLFVLIR